MSILNRNVRVAADGSWVLPNVPANFGPLKARATCIVEDQTVSGESAPFEVPADGSVDVPPIIFGSTTPIPTLVAVSAPESVLTEAGAEVQLAVTAQYASGTSADVSAATNGTRYTVSNAAIATVSNDGLVRAVKSGTVLIQSTLEGAGGMIAIRVALANADTDDDGIPDDVEAELGLDPTNPVDALADSDLDGMTNRREYEVGTDLRAADTDGDGLNDGAEDSGANGFFTNPLLRDTDGDLVGDLLEVQTGSDPLDADSRNFAAALESVRPSLATSRGN